MMPDVELFLKKGILLSPDLKEINFSSRAFQGQNSGLKISENYEEKNKKKSYADFVNLYNSRYRQLQSILKNRQELQGATSIIRINNAQQNENIACIGIVLDIAKTKNNNYIMTLEDPTGSIKAIVTKNSQDYDTAKDITLDEVIGVQGSKGNNVIFVNSITQPDIPLNKELKKSPIDEAALFISDLHIGSKQFLKEPFERFLEWLNGNVGSGEQRKEVRKIKYLFILGDVVEGIGIFPGQENDLEIKDIFEQYRIFTEYIKKIPKHIEVIISPGNHDYVRIAEPQPPLPRLMCEELYNLPNVHFVSNPSIVKISATKDFSGFDVLIYHGYSFAYFANNIESIRLSGGLESTDTIMSYLLKRRHLAPTHGSTRMQMGFEEDPLVITNVPDFFVSGHIHRATVNTYRNVTLLNCSCWITQTDYQEKRGLVPQPGKAVYVDLKTRQTKLLNFEK